MGEDIDTSKLSFDEQVALLMEELPMPVQKFLQGPDRDRISSELANKYSLHADVAGTFERAYIYMLLGVFTPDEFVQELRDGGVDETSIHGLANDINELVFKRLREEERRGYGAPAPVPSPPKSPSPAPSPVSPPIPPPAFAHDDTPTTAVTATQPAPAPVPTPTELPTTPIYSTYASVPVQTPMDPHPYLRTMALDMERASHGMHGTPATPAQSFQTASVPVTYASSSLNRQYSPEQSPATAPAAQTHPAPPPATYPPSSAPVYAPPPVTAPVRLTPVDRAYDRAPITKEFGSDPYREPIEYELGKV